MQKIQCMENEGCAKHQVTVGTVQYSPFTTVKSFVYFHHTPYHNSSIFFV